MIERENLECCDIDNKMVMDFLVVNIDNICIGEYVVSYILVNCFFSLIFVGCLMSFWYFMLLIECV